MTDEERNFRHREFWLWEFARRNEGYRRDYDAFVQKWEQFTPIRNYQREQALDDWFKVKSRAELELKGAKLERAYEFLYVTHMETAAFVAKYHRSPKDYAAGYRSEEILVALLADDETILDNYTDYERRPLATTHEELGGGKVQVVMDINRSLDMILKEVAAIYNDCKYQDPEAKPRREVDQARDDCTRQAVKEAGGRTRSANLPRACGLWVYDHMAANPGMALHKATEHFFSTFQGHVKQAHGQRSLLDSKRISDLYKVIQTSVEEIRFKPLI